MCGITGWVNLPDGEPRDEVLAAMSDSIRHRGPDDSVEYRDPMWGRRALAHRSLSILDLTDTSCPLMLFQQHA